ncbi:triglyceride lipase-cholesterol esterase [Scheffersomyces coipomensis]|uniref:triglyceride lipase-cholesterol esterase n=1 Tax=Scheffersomyces coipomensis TaxID=1788519 RepID=UPI00315CB9D0
MYVPFFGRISLLDWPIIVVSFLLAWSEYIISKITNSLPTIVIGTFTMVTSLIYKFISPVNLMRRQFNDSHAKNDMLDEIDEEEYGPKYQYSINATNQPPIPKEKYDLMIGLLNAKNIREMCQLFGYDVESRIVQTKDNYLLTIQRIIKPGLIERQPNGKVIYLHHGLLMSSEIWVTMIDKYSNLPFLLYELGYDVWLGNNRGNKYSQKHLYYKLQSEKFWDFSLDEFALFDIPNSIDYILKATESEKLTYIGFSQGTAQAFASVSINSDLNQKIDQLIAISPAATPKGLYSQFLDILLKSSPQIFFLLFSRKILMPSIIFWQKIMYPPLFDSLIDVSNYILFNWKALNIPKIQKLSSYAHLYSTTSVKTVVHWFQIISSKNFQMYHDTHHQISGLTPISYPLKNIKVPIHLIYGDIDSLVDIEVMKNQLPTGTTSAVPVANHEHLDNLWGHDVYEKVFKHVLEYLGEDSRVVYNQYIAGSQKLIEDILDEGIGDGDEEEVKEEEEVHQSYLKLSLESINNDDESSIDHSNKKGAVSVATVTGSNALNPTIVPSHRQPSSGGSLLI